MKISGGEKRNRALTLIEVLIVVAVLVVLAILLLPPHSTPAKATRVNCVNNLKQVTLAFRIWAGDQTTRFPMQISIAQGGTKEFIPFGVVSPHFQVMSNELNTPKILVCPADSKKPANSFAFAFANANTSYFINLDADETRSPEMFLTGDDNFMIDAVPIKSGLVSFQNSIGVSWADNRHNKQGDIGLVDGSVQGFTSRDLREALKTSGAVTNRLAMP